MGKSKVFYKIFRFETYINTIARNDTTLKGWIHSNVPPTWDYYSDESKKPANIPMEYPLQPMIRMAEEQGYRFE